MQPLRGRFILAVCAVCACYNTPLLGGIIFQEDFESYSVGSNLIGQGGWTTTVSNAPLNINSGTNLGSKVADGHQALSGESTVLQNVGALSLSSVTTLSADVYAYGTSPVTFNTGMFLASTNNIPQVKWSALPFNTKTWRFSGNDFTEELFTVGFDEAINLSIVIDGPNLETYGIIQHSGGTTETSRFTLPESTITGLDHIWISTDYRNTGQYQGAEWDNILLSSTAVPEPSSFLALSVGVIVVCSCRRNRRRQRHAKSNHASTQKT